MPCFLMLVCSSAFWGSGSSVGRVLNLRGRGQEFDNPHWAPGDGLDHTLPALSEGLCAGSDHTAHRAVTPNCPEWDNNSMQKK